MFTSEIADGRALSVCLYSINLKTARPIGPKFCVGPHMTQGVCMDDRILEILPLPNLNF